MSDPEKLPGRAVLYCGDCLLVLPTIAAESVDSIVTDPPYALEFMGKEWDGADGFRRSLNEADIGRENAFGRMSAHCPEYRAGHVFQEWCEAWARECLRVLKPGGHLLAFGGTRTYHRMVCAVEDAGFEVRDTIAWLYGCLDEQTQAVTQVGLKPYYDLKIGDLVLSYDADLKSYQWDPIEDVFSYEINDTVYRITTYFGEQLVSGNHRCIVERGGVEVFDVAEKVARQRETRIPILEDLPALLCALSDAHQRTGDSQQNMWPRLHGTDDTGRANPKASRVTQSKIAGRLRSMRHKFLAKYEMGKEGSDPSLFLPVQWFNPRRSVEGACSQGAFSLAARVEGCIGKAINRSIKPFLEGWRYLQQTARKLFGGPLLEVPVCFSVDGAEGWIRDGAPSFGGTRNWQMPIPHRSCAPYRPQFVKQCGDQSDAVRDKQRSQTIRAWRGHKTVVGRIAPEYYSGIIWCIKVRTGAFVAVRNGMAFPTGNSGFPKSLDVSKAIDRGTGAAREIVAPPPYSRGKANQSYSDTRKVSYDYQPQPITAPATPESAQWDGWGTALKPAMELIVMARKPLIGTVAANVLRHGTGALNVDGGRVGCDSRPLRDARAQITPSQFGAMGGSKAIGDTALGRWPANVVHDGSAEVLETFPDAPGQQQNVALDAPSARTGNIYGKMNRHGEKSADSRYTDKGSTNFAALPGMRRGDAGSAARFFYNAKADSDDRVASKHPTVKPVDLMAYLVRLVTPKGGTVLDPLAGTGTTGEGAFRRGNEFHLDREASGVSGRHPP